MESKHTENDRDIKTGAIDEEETVCDRSAVNSVFGKSVVVLKNEGIQKIEDETIHAFVMSEWYLIFTVLCCDVILYFILHHRKILFYLWIR